MVQLRFAQVSFFEDEHLCALPQSMSHGFSGLCKILPVSPWCPPKGTGGIRNLIYLAQPPLFTQGTAVIKLADLMIGIVNDNRSHEASPSILERDWWPVKDPIYVFSVAVCFRNVSRIVQRLFCRLHEKQ